MTAPRVLEDLARMAFSPDMPVRVGVAVSGGGDSMALLHLLHATGRFQLQAVTVDHGLRPEAKAEADFVARACARLGVGQATLHWQGAAARGNLMDQARRARLSLIGDWARAQGIAHVALGHTADDQAETFLMRLSRAAGLEGLSGMRPRFEAGGVTWHRPLLAVTRADLRAWLSARDVPWVDDPSNDNLRFDRVKARRVLAALAPLGIGTGTITTVVGHLAQAEAALCADLDRLVTAHVTEAAGDVVIEAAAFAPDVHPEMRRRLINAALIWVSGADYAPRAAKVSGLLADLRDRTLHGCRVLAGPGQIRITREFRAVAGLRVPAGQIWDRWQLGGPVRSGLTIAALGLEGLRHCPDWRATGLPRATLLASPAIWAGAQLVAAPLAGVENGWKAQIARGSFRRSLFRR
ncbi:tRNA lysidine(34) synthetase TilS [Pontitalea aquivivens]|uniref:tRNA lysidine(34) synthetase TilS n=1 Tax=Pontitalea aquivivens TaxID=3388663 RepID=UPI00397069E4